MLDGYSQVGIRYVDTSRGRTVSVTANPSARRVLQVGPLKPSLAETLRTSYGAYVLPENGAERARFLDEHGSRDHRRCDVGPHRRRRGVDVGATKPRRGGELRRRLRHHRHGCRRQSGGGGEQHPRCAHRLRCRHRRRSVDRRAAPVLRRRPLPACGPVAGGRQLSVDPPGQPVPGRDRRIGPDRRRHRNQAGCLRVLDQISQSPTGCRFGVHLRRIAGRVGPPGRCFDRRGGRRR